MKKNNSKKNVNSNKVIVRNSFSIATFLSFIRIKTNYYRGKITFMDANFLQKSRGRPVPYFW